MITWNELIKQSPNWDKIILPTSGDCLRFMAAERLISSVSESNGNGNLSEVVLLIARYFSHKQIDITLDSKWITEYLDKPISEFFAAFPKEEIKDLQDSTYQTILQMMLYRYKAHGMMPVLKHIGNLIDYYEIDVEPLIEKHIRK